MDYKVASPGRGLAWFRGGVRMLDRDPRGLLTVALALAIINQLPGLATPLSPAWFAGSVLISLLGPTLAAGLLTAIADASAGRPVRLATLFTGFVQPGVRGNLVQLGVLTVALATLAGVAAWQLMGKDNIDVFMRLMHKQISPDSPAAQAMAVPFLKALLAALTITMVLMAGLFFAVPQVLFQGRAALPAFARSLAACSGNVLALTVYGLAFVAAGIAVAIGLGIVGAFLALLGDIGLQLLRLVMLALTVVVMVVSSSGNYLAWRELFDSAGSTPEPPPRAGIVV